jgi:hypothetical protein
MPKIGSVVQPSIQDYCRKGRETLFLFVNWEQGASKLVATGFPVLLGASDLPGQSIQFSIRLHW